MGSAHSLHSIWEAKKQTPAGSIGQIILHLDRMISHKRWISETVHDKMFLSSYWKKEIRGQNCIAANRENRIAWF